MKLTGQIGTLVAVAVGALALAASAAAGGPLSDYRDGPERGGTVMNAQTSVAGYLDANERVRAAQPVTSTLVAEYRDAFERAQPPSETFPVATISVSDASGFDWGSAAVGASSAILLALLVGASLIVTRHSRGRPLAR